ncbi:coiled-coil domain-containing protein 94-like [Centruroides sculpturatus]|uniref:coiled-coil domain-containing protein 94-like n=1 Tax=Centruroides sculpturatus TaxID=218467 RepID=UPI000C6E0DD5|nr:coiled-coil domain-containing protein 94-like [Centruroides sculpturatus]
MPYYCIRDNHKSSNNNSFLCSLSSHFFVFPLFTSCLLGGDIDENEAREGGLALRQRGREKGHSRSRRGILRDNFVNHVFLIILKLNLATLATLIKETLSARERFNCIIQTDPQNADYVVENGATRNFQALKLAEEQAEREAKEIEEEEKSNPMKLLENRTKASKREMELLESLEELRDLNQRHAQVDFDNMLKQYAVYEENLRVKQEEEDEAFIREVFGKSDEKSLKRTSEEIVEEIIDDKKDSKPIIKRAKKNNPTDILSEEKLPSGNSSKNTWGEV